MGCIYLLLEVDKDGNERHKIGITKRDVKFRINELQTGNSNIITLLNSYDSKNYLKIERWLHRKYKTQRTETKNEWFSLTDEDVIKFIDSCKEADALIQFMLENNTFYN